MLGRIRNILNGLPRQGKSVILAVFDAVALLAVLWLSYQLRLGGTFSPNMAQIALMVMAPLIAIPVFLRFGLYRAVIRYLPDRAMWTVFSAMALATLAWVFVLFIAEAAKFGVLPRSIPIFYFVLGALVVGGSRFAAKYLLFEPRERVVSAVTMLIYGAGEAGRQLATALRTRGGGLVAGFLDDDPQLQGRDVVGLRVHSPAELGGLIKDLGVSEVILSIPSIDAARRQQIIADLNRLPVKIRTLPAISEIASGKYLVSQLREIDIDDLLGRSSVPADPALIRPMIEGRTIMVTGAGGSIGSELCRIIAAWRPKKLVLFEANEFALYQIERQLGADATFALVPVLGSVTDGPLVARAIATHGVEAIFHAAAHKHVPLVEANVLEGVRNNVFGTRTIAEAALAGGVKDFVLISTDKAVRPTNVMGATKRWAELIVREIGDRPEAKRNGQRFAAVRFGNVLGSNGSVVPLFREQIAAGGPVTLTDERMTRYFMSIHEAAELIVQAGTLSQGGDLFLLDMGQPVKIRDLAENMIRLAGLSVRSAGNPEGDIAIEVTGIRPAEKLYEELFYDPAHSERTSHRKIMRAHLGAPLDTDLTMSLAALRAGLERADEDDVRRLLFEVIAD
ncbi:MAG TPA: nucleoside-diphosphate sugar epimerase/dehydratase [Devosia sp.]|nr:nucleoside-diphosphate sugar epimerase/dehydratase [Devosia sp.]